MSEIRWMQDGPFGVMVHYVKGIMPRSGNPDNDWNSVVDRFPVESFCDSIASTGARWLIFPFGQNSGYYCAPNNALETMLPGHGSRRDLWGEIADNLTARGLKMIAYLPTEVHRQSSIVQSALGWDRPDSRKTVFQQRYREVIASWSTRYGDKLAGWWFDGCYNRSDWDNRRFDWSSWQAAARAGNSHAILAMNQGAGDFTVLFPGQDFLAGEVNDLSVRPQQKLISGAQWHTLVWLDCCWLHDKKPGPIADPRFTDSQLFDFVETCHRCGGGVTLNLGIYQDGKIADPTLEQVRRLGRQMATG